MRLNPEQLMVIKEVRALMEEKGKVPKYYTRYICHAVGKVLSVRVEAGFLSSDAAQTLKNQLVTGILAGISHMVTFGGFMTVTCPVFREINNRDAAEFVRVSHMARLAWLDWIIYTGEIKVDLLAGEER
jgi:hypothetical protein